MVENISLDYSDIFIKDYEIEFLKNHILDAHNMIHNKTGPGKDFLGWVDHPINYDTLELIRLKESANRVRGNSKIFIVVGIGGSYLGARAVIEALSHSFYNDMPLEQRKFPQVYFVGNNMSGTYLNDFIEIIKDKDISINVISKSGTTTEPAIAFRILKEYMEKKYGKNEAKERIIVTTDKSKGALRELAEQEGYETFIIPKDIGGRYSVLTTVGLLAIAVAGINIDKLIEGAQAGRLAYGIETIEDNICYQYAAIRNILSRKGKNIEVLISYEPSMHYLSEWWKQLYGESEGKEGKGIFPASVNFSTDLHSFGQFLQDGRRDLFETVLNIIKPRKDLVINESKDNLDGLNYLSGKNMDYVNKMAYKGTLLAHIDGGVPNIVLNVPRVDEYYLGKLIYLFEKACGISGYLLGVNPFNQPGVELYKNNMFALLGKPGFEELHEKLIKRL
ncbi:MAG: glucose-6-phosphate isomerase [Vulcanibacillus sp.]